MLKILILLLFPSIVFAGGSGLTHLGPQIIIPLYLLFFLILISVVWILYRFVIGVYKPINNKKQ